MQQAELWKEHCLAAADRERMVFCGVFSVVPTPPRGQAVSPASISIERGKALDKLIKVARILKEVET